jgi:hypothetical protein
MFGITLFKTDLAGQSGLFGISPGCGDGPGTIINADHLAVEMLRQEDGTRAFTGSHIEHTLTGLQVE